ncbi:hypothetical protein FRC12_023349 [Ceratobasidium sp. 428]|nr:hypothetical protein FRC12_023349 [Ceratobasidium sp. 428]
MNYLHSQNPPLVHGCLRLDKIFVTADGTAKIGEFGLSFLTRDFALHAPSISQAGLSRWMSPELVDVDPDTGTVVPTTASDVWALACTLLEVSANSVMVSRLHDLSTVKIILGEIPYNRHKHELRVRKAIIKGEQPGSVGHSEDEDFSFISPILERCWDMTPNSRLSVPEMQEDIQRLFKVHISSRTTGRKVNHQQVFNTSSPLDRSLPVTPPPTSMGSLGTVPLLSDEITSTTVQYHIVFTSGSIDFNFGSLRLLSRSFCV